MSRRLEYWLKVPSKERAWITFDVIPLQTISDSFYFDEYVEIIKQLGFQYRVVETTEIELAHS
jgi:hypothetical protein